MARWMSFYGCSPEGTTARQGIVLLVRGAHDHGKVREEDAQGAELRGEEEAMAGGSGSGRGEARPRRSQQGGEAGERGRRRGAPGGEAEQWAAPRARRRRDLGASRDAMAGEVSRAGARKGEERGSARWKRRSGDRG